MSLTIAGIVVFLFGKAADAVGYHGTSVTVENLVITFSTLAQFVGLVMAYIGRLRHGDITWFGKKV